MICKGKVRAWILTVGLVSASVSFGGDPSEAQVKDMMEMMRKVSTPGQHHAALAQLVGEWDVEVSLLMPGGAQKSSGRARYEWAVEGLWLTQKLEATLMGMPYQSFAVMGYDNYAKNHVVATVSSADTSLNVARGVVVDPQHKVTSVYGALDEYTTGELNKPFRAVTRIVDNDRHVIEIWDLGIGASGAKVLEFNYTRKK